MHTHTHTYVNHFYIHLKLTQYSKSLFCYFCLVINLCLTLCDPVDCSPPGSSVHGISWQEQWSGLPFPPAGDLLNTGIEPASPVSPALQADSLPLSHQESLQEI